MNKDDFFASNEVTIANIKKISENQSIVEERRICELSDLARDAASVCIDMKKNGYEIYEILSVISEGFIEISAKTHDFSLPENKARLLSYASMENEYDKVVFTELFCDFIKQGGIIISESDFLPSHFGSETVAYVKNPLADEAYDVFSQDMNEPRLRYSKSLAEAAKAVSSREVEYALLPLEERGGARLSAVAELLFREDLKINSITPVFGYDGVADMKYALVSKHFTVPEVNPDDDRYLEVRLRIDSSIPLSELFMAADAFGMNLYRVNTISFRTEDGEVPYYSIVFRDEGRDFSSLLTYMTLFSGAYTPVGIYKNLE